MVLTGLDRDLGRRCHGLTQVPPNAPGAARAAGEEERDGSSPVRRRPRRVPKDGAVLRRARGQPAPRGVGRGGADRPGPLHEGGGDGAARLRGRRAARRPLPARLPLQRDHRPGARRRRRPVGRHRPRRLERPRRALPAHAGEGGAATALGPCAVRRVSRRGGRDDRAERRQRPAWHADPSGTRRGRVRHQRLEDVHRQRADGRRPRGRGSRPPVSPAASPTSAHALARRSRLRSSTRAATFRRCWRSSRPATAPPSRRLRHATGRWVSWRSRSATPGSCTAPSCSRSAMRRRTSVDWSTRSAPGHRTPERAARRVEQAFGAVQRRSPAVSGGARAGRARRSVAAASPWPSARFDRARRRGRASRRTPSRQRGPSR